MSPTRKRAALDKHRRHRAAAAFELCFDHDPLGSTVRVGLEIEQLGLQQDRLFEPVEIGLFQRRHFDVEDFAAELLDDDLMLQQLLAHALGPRLGLVDLVDGDDDRRLRGFGVADRFDRLLHDAVVGGDHQHDDVGDIGAARAHRGKGLVARRVDEGDLSAAAQIDLIGADMLGDAAGLAGCDIGFAQRVEQRGLAVVDMAHDRDHRRARLEHVLGVFGAAQARSRHRPRRRGAGGGRTR